MGTVPYNYDYLPSFLQSKTCKLSRHTVFQILFQHLIKIIIHLFRCCCFWYSVCINWGNLYSGAELMTSRHFLGSRGIIGTARCSFASSFAPGTAVSAFSSSFLAGLSSSSSSAWFGCLRIVRSIGCHPRRIAWLSSAVVTNWATATPESISNYSSDTGRLIVRASYKDIGRMRLIIRVDLNVVASSSGRAGSPNHPKSR